MIRTQIVVVESPPAVRKTEGKVEPAIRPDSFHQQQKAARSEEFAGVQHGAAKVGRRVQHVRGEDDVITAGFESLRDGVGLNVEKSVPNRRRIAELAGGLGQKHGRDVGERIFDILVRDIRQHRRRRCSGAGANLKQAHGAPRDLADGCPNEVAGNFVKVAADRGVLIDLLGLFDRPVRKDKLHGVIGAAQHSAQFFRATAKDIDLDAALWIGGIESLELAVRLGTLREFDEAEPVACAYRQAILNQDAEQAVHLPAASRHDLERVRQLLHREVGLAEGIESQLTEDLENVRRVDGLELRGKVCHPQQHFAGRRRDEPLDQIFRECFDLLWWKIRGQRFRLPGQVIDPSIRIVGCRNRALIDSIVRCQGSGIATHGARLGKSARLQSRAAILDVQPVALPLKRIRGQRNRARNSVSVEAAHVRLAAENIERRGGVQDPQQVVVIRIERGQPLAGKLRCSGLGELLQSRVAPHVERGRTTFAPERCERGRR